MTRNLSVTLGSFALLVLGLRCSTPFADVLGWGVSVSPASPTSLQPIYARVTNTQTCAIDSRTIDVRQDGAIVQIVARGMPNCIPTGPGTTVDISLGALHAGSFSVVVVDESGTQLTSTQFAVGDKYPARSGTNFPLVDYSDHWWNPQESGWGLSIVQHPSDQLFAAWFVYNNSSMPTWYTLQPGQWTNSRTYSGPVYRTSGPYFGSPFDPRNVSVSQAGTATLIFDSATTGTLTYTVDGVSGSKAITRLIF